METRLPVYIGEDAISRLIHYCDDNNLDQFMLVADQNTYPAQGEAVERALQEHGVDVKSVVLHGEEVIANEHYLMQVFLDADRVNRVYLAVGSGTITDITRFVSHRTKASFISVPTAPSVDGFTSIGAPLVIEGRKQTFITHPPLAVFADVNTLRDAPQRMIAAGFGDLLGKYTSLADWKLGHMLWDEPYDEEIAQRSREAVQASASRAEEIGRASREGVRHLMEGLIEAGFGMLGFGSSNPASGAEHHFSHYWETRLLQENKPAILHGAKVGYATTLVAKRYEQVATLTQREVEERLEVAKLPDREQEIRQIRDVYGPISDQVIELQQPFLNMSPSAFQALKHRVLERWTDIQDIAATVPSSRQLIRWLEAVGGPTDAETLGVDERDVAVAVRYAHYFRNRLTIMKLNHLLGVLGE